MKIRIYYPDYNDEHKEVLSAFAEGVSGSEFVPVTDYRPSEVAVIYGTYKKAVPQTRTKKVIIESQNKYGGEVIYIDSGYIRRDEYYSVGVGGMLGNGIAYYLDSPEDRFEKLGVEMGGDGERDKVLLIGQVPWDSNTQNVDYVGWVNNHFRSMRKVHGDETVVFRPHPKANDVDFGIPKQFYSDIPDIKQDLARAITVAAYNSNSIVDAVIARVPGVFWYGPGSIWEQTGSLNDIAYAQWNMDEMKSGEAWKRVQKALTLN